ncbi:hypothetical protein D3C87_1349860 [compost metagenome]
MKALLLFLVTAASFSAHAILDSHYGKVKSYGFKYTCSYYNKTNSTLDMKYVIFNFSGMSGENPDFETQVRIDKRVQPGDTISWSVNESHAFTANHCRFLAR